MPAERADPRSRQRIERADEYIVECKPFEAAVKSRFDWEAFRNDPGLARDRKQTLELRDGVFVQDRRVLVLEALRQSLAIIAANGFTVLGDLHQTRYIALDDTRDYVPRSGGDSTVNVAESRCWSGGEFGERCEASSGAVYRTITTFREDGWPRDPLQLAARERRRARRLGPGRLQAVVVRAG